MYQIQVKEAFEAAHRIEGYEGKCNRLHGHSWVVEAVVTGTELDSLGMLVDFKAVKQELKEVLQRMDHQYLNEMEPFLGKMNPTAENMARCFYEELAKAEIFCGNAALRSVCVWESPNSCVTYFPEE